MKLSTYICTCTSVEIHTHTDRHMKTPLVASSAGSIKSPGVKTFPTLFLRVSAPAVPWGMGLCSRIHRCTKTTSTLSPLSIPLYPKSILQMACSLPHAGSSHEPIPMTPWVCLNVGDQYLNQQNKVDKKLDKDAYNEIISDDTWDTYSWKRESEYLKTSQI